MSRSKKWRLEWAFFLGENGRRQYNHICKKCVHGCKQSFRACLVACPHYNSKRSIAQILGIGRTSAYILVKEGHFKIVRIGNAIRISKRSFDEWLDSLDL